MGMVMISCYNLVLNTPPEPLLECEYVYQPLAVPLKKLQYIEYIVVLF